ncbi:MAG: ABC transporter ATP-binding protein, partial [Holophagae bacterium]
DLTARENLTVFGRLMGLGQSDCRRAADRLLETIGLADRADDLVASLSGGMKRRLNVAAGVIHRPRLLLLDEPTVGVDPRARERIHELLLELRHDGLAMVLTTHDLEQAAELADRVGILIDGRIRAQGRVDDLIGDSFGGGRELIVALREPAPEASTSTLEAAGLRPSRDRRIWTGRVDRGREDLSSLAADLESTGLRVDEVRVREPGLRGVFFRLAGRDIDA